MSLVEKCGLTSRSSRLASASRRSRLSFNVGPQWNVPVVLRLSTALLSAVILSGCSTSPSKGEDDYMLHLEQVFETQATCHGAWRGLVAGWVERGGSFASIKDARARAYERPDTPFAQLLRRAWRAQPVARSQSELGTWPVSQESNWAVSTAIERASRGFVPRQCESSIWLDSVLWDAIRFVGGDPLATLKPVEAPGSLVWESPTAQHWVQYWLFVRVE